MIGRMRPLPHPDPFVDVTRGYVTRVGDALQARGVPLSNVWLDPSDPRDATFVLGLRALVWNESEGFVLGEFVSGEPGVRTVLRDPVRLGDSVLPDPRSVPGLLERGGEGAPASLRSFAAGHDGFEDELVRYTV
ncbi:hypothetical protein SAMN04489713_10162 [Actinomadura madurae]|uniref:DUF6292 domain-containing protein n=2 Tax=Actinomadura madurae TaxID=1993 RepID=A0A1I4VXX5_9ACTN|nr:hypothetical protein SAMN04489713_10162 [Actinomadura madurae]SPT58267.1 Uncharacterised protein [Actinomadura madurae]